MAKTLTVAGIEKTKPGDKRIEIADAVTRGLYLVVQPSGSKSWSVRYRVGGRSQKYTIGPYPTFGLPEARSAAREVLRSAIGGGDPSLEKKRARSEAGRRDDLFPSVARDYIARFQKPKNRTWKETARLLGLKPDPALPDSSDDPSSFILAPDGPAREWEKRRIGTLKRSEVRDYIDDLALRVPIGANRTLAALKRMFKWTVERDIIEVDVTRDVPKPTPQQHRKRVLTDDELYALWRAAERTDWPFGPWVKLLILTGQRRDEVAGIRSSEVDPRFTLWTIPDARAKNGKPHLVPLSMQAAAVLAGLPKVQSKRGLFLTTTGTSPISGFSKAKQRINSLMLEELRSLAEQRGDDPKRVRIPEWRFHDIRRTMATRMPKLKVDLAVVEKVLNHTSGTFAGIVGVYQLYSYEDEKRAALQAWGDYVERLVINNPAPNVVRLAWGKA